MERMEHCELLEPADRVGLAGPLVLPGRWACGGCRARGARGARGDCGAHRDCGERGTCGTYVAPRARVTWGTSGPT